MLSSSAEKQSDLRVDDWVFIPDEPPADSGPAVRNAPLTPTGSNTSTTVDEMVCCRGELVWHHPVFAPIGISVSAFAGQSQTTRSDPEWAQRTRIVHEAPRYVRGEVRQPGQTLLNLTGWHRVYRAQA